MQWLRHLHPLDWGLGSAISSACLGVSQLVTNSTMFAITDIDLSVPWNLGAFHLAVRDDSPSLLRQRHSRLGLAGRGLKNVIVLSRGVRGSAHR
jgi:hypothetical protein